MIAIIREDETVMDSRRRPDPPPAAPAQDWRTLARRSPVLAALPQAARIAARQRDLAPGRTLFRRGDRPRAMYFVLRGEVRLVRRSVAGREIVLQRARNGPLAEASLDQPSYHCDAVGEAASALLAVPIAAFRDALADAGFRGAWTSHLARELRRTRAQCERLGLRRAQDRILHYLESEGDDGRLQLTQTKKAWAVELGLTHEALYRALRTLARSGLVTVGKNRIALAAKARA